MTKEQAIIKAASALFLKQGFEATSMDNVACKAKVAKQTVYNYFSSKEELFCAIVMKRCASLFDHLPDNAGTHNNMGAYLEILAVRIMYALFTTETLELYRLVVAETPRFPELGRKYYESGPKVAVDMLAKFLEKHGIKKSVSTAHAKQFFGMLTGDLLSHALLDLKYKPSAKDREKMAKNTVAFFLAALHQELSGS